MYSTSDCLIHQNFQDSGPVICNTITLPDESGVNPTFYTFPYIGNLTDGQKYHDTATATAFELCSGRPTASGPRPTSRPCAPADARAPCRRRRSR